MKVLLQTFSEFIKLGYTGRLSQYRITINRMKFLYFWLLIVSRTILLVGAMHRGKFYGIMEVPYMAQLYLSNQDGSMSSCGATILSEFWVITAAHCIENNHFMHRQVRVGSSLIGKVGTLINISQVITHENYTDSGIYPNDISLIKLEKPIEFNELQHPIPIARVSPRVEDSITVSGFGYGHYGVSVDNLQVSHVSLVSEDECNKTNNINEDMFCTSVKNIDLCFGDSGGPAVANGKLIGVITQGCDYTYPNVCIKVSHFYDWIVKHTGIQYDD